MKKATILHVQKRQEDSHWLESILQGEIPAKLSPGFKSHSQRRILTVPDPDQARARLVEGGVDAVLLESAGSDEEDLRALSQLNSAAPEIPIIVLSPTFQSKALSRLLGNGVHEYLAKEEVTSGRISEALRSAVERQRFQIQNPKNAEETRANLNIPIKMSLDGVAVFRKGIILAANPAFDRILGYEPGKTKGKALSSLCKHEYQSYFQSQVERGVETPAVIVAQKKDGSSLYLEYTSRPCIFKDETAFVIDIHDITERQKSVEALRHQAYWDFVTDLPNRYLFFDRLNAALDQARQTGGKVALFFIDLDHFKVINDTLGLGMGDQVLKAVSRRLSHSVRRGDTVARLGADEFTIILQDSQELADLPAVAGKTLEAIAKPIQIEENELHVSASIGVSLYPDDAKTAEKLVQQADVAMFQAKEKGRNDFCLYQITMDAGGMEKLDLQAGLYRAFEKEEFHLVYQPQVDLETGKVVGLEALLRWNHPVRGPISPNDFIPLVEETGLIIPLGQWILRKACAQNKAWQDMGFAPVRIAVNLSAVQFLKHTLPFLIDKTLKETGLEHRFLELEITEGIAMKDPKYTLAALREMTEIFKLRITLDDFGVAYSSLGYLMDFPLHCLKIDKSFTGGIGQGKKQDAIVSAIIVLAQNMGLEVVAEGVETEEQLIFLKSRGCNTCQGYLFHQPLMVEQVEKILRGQTARRSPEKEMAEVGGAASKGMGSRHGTA